MRRLIDANALLEEHCGDCSPQQRKMCENDPVCGLAMWIIEAPTVDAVEVVHGRWVSSWCGFDCCSECRKVYADGYLTAMGIKPRTQFNYCPNCGAKMDGDGNG